MLSVGVESLSDRLLAMVGRSHDAAAAEDAVRRAMAHGFEAVNVDLMFALPTQTLDELDHDLCRVLALGVDQLSTYPIFGFPYTEWGQQLGLARIGRPRGDVIRRMLDLIRRRCREHGLEQCAVWSFLRPRKKKFSSITRHHYLGFGPSAASMTGRQFCVNTFSIEEYAAALPDRSPVALVLPVDRRLEMAYWLYWRVYEMKLSGADFRELFGEDLEAVYGRLLRPLAAPGHDGATQRLLPGHRGGRLLGPSLPERILAQLHQSPLGPLPPGGLAAGGEAVMGRAARLPGRKSLVLPSPRRQAWPAAGPCRSWAAFR